MSGNVELTKQFIDIFHLAKRIPGMMPDLPAPLTPRHIHILECICLAPAGGIRVSEIAKEMHSTTPSITRLVNELTAEKLVQKSKDQQDRRVCSVYATPAGRNLYRIYGEEYLQRLAVLLAGIPEEDMRTTIRVIQQTYDRMSQHPIHLSDLSRPGSHQ